jgi:NAD-dependent deacetylase sirtuin 2
MSNKKPSVTRINPRIAAMQSKQNNEESEEKELMNSFRSKLSISNSNKDSHLMFSFLSSFKRQLLTNIISAMQSRTIQNIIVMDGAGISTRAKIPDFRSSGTGIFANLMNPEKVFSLSGYTKNPKLFYDSCKPLFVNNAKPTLTHCFIKLLQDKGILLREYTQNIDTLSSQASISDDKIVTAHGSFRNAYCTYAPCQNKNICVENDMKEAILNDRLPVCPKCKNTTARFDITLYEEDLPKRFEQMHKKDFAKCDLLLILGTSLRVKPFADLITMVPRSCPRIFINREDLQTTDQIEHANPLSIDIWLNGDCDEMVQKLCSMLNWKQDLETIYVEKQK